MKRIPWTRLEGGDVEAVVALLVNRKRPNSIRITPSTGDGGVDILEKGAAPGGGDVVYQVKKYAEPLTSKQKSEIHSSFTTLKSTPRWDRLNVEEWKLVTPWNPTPETYAWFDDLEPEQPGLTRIWHGLDYVEGLAAEYPAVIDYYLGDGETAILRAFRTISQYSDLEDAPSPMDLATRFADARRVLDDDPLYAYDYETGHGPLPKRFGTRTGLIMTVARTDDASNTSWTAVHVIARCAESQNLRPVTLEGKIVVPAGDEKLEAALESFAGYGAPFTSPHGSFQGKLDAPGGLSAELTGASLQLSPTTSEVGDPLRLEVLSPEGDVLASVEAIRRDVSSGGLGVRILLEERYKTFTLEDRYHSEGSLVRAIGQGDFAGQGVLDVQRGLRFLSVCRPPNEGRISHAHTPEGRGVLDRNLCVDWPEDLTQALHVTMDAVDLLVEIQKRTDARVLTPDFSSISGDNLAHWRFVVGLLSGQSYARPVSPDGRFYIELAHSVVLPTGSFTLTSPLVAEVGDQRIALGTIGYEFLGAEVIEKVPSENGALFTLKPHGDSIQVSLHEEESSAG
ncbi:restriction endonuclease [Pseudoclavibacter sp. VKM Ac-2888]|uniref:restriction endonuclease n=1 Tax=Pseudoclavibacter sp. VKM Ac-2888 TaxID=2783830 RepID=UPI00188A21A9|nr:restriction endonuclease [Pseudoclavibacter sp. VKM Ac-2888]MBF4549362.1 restriction endonuclease [Pseudoclavibacter sp. VKM Ac-2888]